MDFICLSNCSHHRRRYLFLLSEIIRSSLLRLGWQPILICFFLLLAWSLSQFPRHLFLFKSFIIRWLCFKNRLRSKSDLLCSSQYSPSLRLTHSPHSLSRCSLYLAPSRLNEPHYFQYLSALPSGQCCYYIICEHPQLKLPTHHFFQHQYWNHLHRQR